MVGPTATAVVGIGATEFSKDSGRSELRLAIEAITAALADAGLRPEDVDGLVTLSMDNNGQQAVARNLGVQALTFFCQPPAGGGGGCGTVALANAAIIAGNAEVVVCYRAMNERSRQRFGQPRVKPGIPTGLADSWQIDSSWTMPFGMVTAASYVAQTAQRYLHEYNVTSEAFGRVAVNQRNYAQTNPNAYFNGRPITLEEHQDSRMIADPLHLLDCCQESDGAVALVIMSLERARDLRQTPIQVLAAAQGIGAEQHAMATVYRENIAQTLETKVVGDQLWKRSGLAPADMDVANLYDHFSCAVVMQLEALGFCRWGEAPGLIQDGGLALDGVIPTNTNGGQLSEAYIHGFNGMAEMVRQLRGTAANQVPGARLGVVTSGSHVPTSGVVLGRAD
jgi:acetyl-CoA acetyltransferase